jgi:hypothetical protein
VHKCSLEQRKDIEEKELLLERALHILVSRTVFDAAHEASGKKYFATNDNIIVYGDQPGCVEVVKAAMWKLNVFGNRCDHDELDDIRPREKPEIINNSLVVANAVWTKVR